MACNLLLNIKSKIIIQKTFSFIQENIKYKLIRYSKYSQKKLGLELTDYKLLYSYYKNIEKINWSKYLCFYIYIQYPGKEEERKKEEEEEYNDSYLKEKLINDLSKYNIEYGNSRFKKSIIKFFRKYLK